MKKLMKNSLPLTAKQLQCSTIIISTRSSTPCLSQEHSSGAFSNNTAYFPGPTVLRVVTWTGIIQSGASGPSTSYTNISTLPNCQHHFLHLHYSPIPTYKQLHLNNRPKSPSILNTDRMMKDQCILSLYNLLPATMGTLTSKQMI